MRARVSHMGASVEGLVRVGACPWPSQTILLRDMATDFGHIVLAKRNKCAKFYKTMANFWRGVVQNGQVQSESPVAQRTGQTGGKLAKTMDSGRSGHGRSGPCAFPQALAMAGEKVAKRWPWLR